VKREAEIEDIGECTPPGLADWLIRQTRQPHPLEGENDAR